MKLGSSSFFALFRELRRGTGDPRPLAVAGARELVPLLARELRAGGDPAAVVEGRFEDAAVLVWIGPTDEAVLRQATRAGVPIVAVTEDETVPYVLATELVRVPPGSGFPVDEIASVIARRLGEDSTSLAARLPVLRPAVCEELIRAFSRRNGMIAAAVFMSGIDMPVLTVNQARLVMRMGMAYGGQSNATRTAGLVGVVGAGLAFRAISRELRSTMPRAGWAVKGAVAYTGTRAVGEAALRYFAARAEAASS